MTISGGINDNITSRQGTESQIVEVLFFIPYGDLLGATLDEVTVEELEQALDGGTTGFGEYLFDIGVSVNKGERIGCNKQDDGESVDWEIELLSLDYSITEIKS